MYLIPRSYDGLPRDKFGILTSATDVGVRRMIVEGYLWGADNQQFGGKFSETGNGKKQRANSLGFFDWLKTLTAYITTCRFVAIPDYLERRHDGKVWIIKGDAAKTLEMFEQYAPQVRAMGFPVAYVAQDGSELLPFPAQFDALFVGGSTEWKLGRGAEKVIRRAQGLEKWVHIGRINSRGRFGSFRLLGCDSCDGTCIKYAPDLVIQNIIGWTSQPTLFRLGE